MSGTPGNSRDDPEPSEGQFPRISAAFIDFLGCSEKNKWCPEEASIVTSNNLILFFKGNLVFPRGTNGGTEKILLSGSFPDPNSIHTVSIHFFPFQDKPNHALGLDLP